MSGEVADVVRFEECYAMFGQVPIIALRGARCNRTTHSGERCGNQARFFYRASGDVVVGVCGHPGHRPDEHEVDEWIDAHDHECGKYVVREREGDPTFGRHGREQEMDERVTECGAQAAVYIERLDGEVVARCFRHARDSWIDKFEPLPQGSAVEEEGGEGATAGPAGP